MAPYSNVQPKLVASCSFLVRNSRISRYGTQSSPMAQIEYRNEKYSSYKFAAPLPDMTEFWEFERPTKFCFKIRAFRTTLVRSF